MVMMRKTVLFAIAMVCAMGAGPSDVAAGAQPTASTTADFAGRWVYDPSAGDDPKKPGEGEQARGGPPGGFSGGVPGGGGMGFGGSGAPPDRAKLERMRRIVQAETTPPKALVITADPKQIAVTADDGRAEVLILDGKRHLRLTGDGELYTTTRWVAGQLVSERRYDEGIRATRTYVVEAPAGGARRIIVTLKLEGGGLGSKLPELKRVYTASPP
jgi:hypothetical protein